MLRKFISVKCLAISKQSYPGKNVGQHFLIEDNAEPLGSRQGLKSFIISKMMRTSLAVEPVNKSYCLAADFDGGYALFADSAPGVEKRGHQNL